MADIPFLVNRGRESSMLRRAQIIRILDESTRIPVEHALVTVQIDYCFAGRQPVCRQGRSNSQGIFVFLFEQPIGWLHVFVSVVATGYRAMDKRFGLTDERVIALARIAPRSAGKNERAVRPYWETGGRLLSWPEKVISIGARETERSTLFQQAWREGKESVGGLAKSVLKDVLV